MKTVELDKLTSDRKFVASVIEFMEFCNDNDVHLFDCNDTSTSLSSDDMLYAFLDIDKKEVEVEVEVERQALVDSLQKGD